MKCNCYELELVVNLTQLIAVLSCLPSASVEYVLRLPSANAISLLSPYSALLSSKGFVVRGCQTVATEREFTRKQSTADPCWQRWRRPTSRIVGILILTIPLWAGRCRGGATAGNAEPLCQAHNKKELLDE